MSECGLEGQIMVQDGHGGQNPLFWSSGGHVRGSNSGPRGQILIRGGSKIILPRGHFDMWFWSDFSDF